MEWRAGFGTVSPQCVALIQLALQEQVFLLDLCAHAISHHSITVDFIRALLLDKSIIKLGRRLKFLISKFFLLFVVHKLWVAYQERYGNSALSFE